MSPRRLILRLPVFRAGGRRTVTVDPAQLVLAVESAEAEFRRWLESQPAPAYLSAVAS